MAWLRGRGTEYALVAFGVCGLCCCIYRGREGLLVASSFGSPHMMSLKKVPRLEKLYSLANKTSKLTAVSFPLASDSRANFSRGR